MDFLNEVQHVLFEFVVRDHAQNGMCAASSFHQVNKQLFLQNREIKEYLRNISRTGLIQYIDPRTITVLQVVLYLAS